MYKDGLKGDQPQAFDAITERVLAGQQIVKLTGYAGTGKTFLVARIAQFLRDKGFDVQLAAPTHKAKGVLQDKLGDYGLEVETIHRLLGLRLVADMDDDTGGHILKAGTPIDKGLVICDEASMIGEELQAQISRCPRVQWIFVGDPAQLPPVGEGPSDLLSNPDAELKEVLRQAGGSEILDVATALRHGSYDVLESRFERDVRIVRDADALFSEALEAFQSAEYQEDAAYARMLVFRNARREAINQAMRTLLVNSPDPYTKGEWLVMYAQHDVTGDRLNQLAERAKQAYGRKRRELWDAFWKLKNSGHSEVLHVSQEVRIDEAYRDTVTVNGQTWQTWHLEITTYGQEYEINVLDKSEKPRWENERTRLREEALALRKRQDELQRGTNEYDDLDGKRRSVWGQYFSLEQSFAWVDYAYAMTTHKAQGSTFQHAFVDVPDLMASGGMRQKLLYTAATRPALTLTYFTNHKNGIDTE